MNPSAKLKKGSSSSLDNQSNLVDETRGEHWESSSNLDKSREQVMPVRRITAREIQIRTLRILIEWTVDFGVVNSAGS